MNLAYPATTEQLVSANQRISPDAVLAAIRKQFLAGAIREIRGRWYEMRPPEDRPFYHAGKRTIVRRLISCDQCGSQFYPEKIAARGKQEFCSRKCHHASMRKPRSNCEVCGKPCKHPANRMCSRTCVVKYRLLRR